MFERGGIWYASFRVNGRLIQKSTGLTDKKKAREVEAGLKLRLLANVGAGNVDIGEMARNVTVREMLERWLNEHSVLLEPNTQARQKTAVNQLVKAFGDKSLSGITPAFVQQYKVARLKQVMPATFNREYDALTSAFKYAVNIWKLAVENPLLHIKKEPERNARTRWLKEDEQERLFAACPDWLREILLFLVNTTMREGEALELTWDRVDMEQWTATISKITRTKNTSVKVVPLNTVARGIIVNRWNNRRPGCNLVFPSQTGNIFSRTRINVVFRKARAKSGITDCRIHDLRHTGASRLVQKGVPLYVVGKLLGHKSPVSTARYAHLDLKTVREAVMWLDGDLPKLMIVDGHQKDLCTGNQVSAMNLEGEPLNNTVEN